MPSLVPWLLLASSEAICADDSPDLQTSVLFLVQFSHITENPGSALINCYFFTLKTTFYFFVFSNLTKSFGPLFFISMAFPQKSLNPFLI